MTPSGEDTGSPTVVLGLVRDRTLRLRATVHTPRLGCGLAGGRREMIEPLVTEELERHGVEVTVYDLA
jgi:hypothetical protein